MAAILNTDWVLVIMIGHASGRLAIMGGVFDISLHILTILKDKFGESRMVVIAILGN